MSRNDSSFSPRVVRRWERRWRNPCCLRNGTTTSGSTLYLVPGGSSGGHGNIPQYPLQCHHGDDVILLLHVSDAMFLSMQLNTQVHVHTHTAHTYTHQYTIALHVHDPNMNRQAHKKRNNHSQSEMANTCL